MRTRFSESADVAQLVEQLTRNEQVVRSTRIIGSSFYLYISTCYVKECAVIRGFLFPDILL